MEFSLQVLVRLVGADDHVYPNFMDVMQWLSESDMLEMIVDKLSPSVSEKLKFHQHLAFCGIIYMCDILVVILIFLLGSESA